MSISARVCVLSRRIGRSKWVVAAAAQRLLPRDQVLIRRLFLLLTATVLLFIALSMPETRQMVTESAQFSVALFAALLTGEAVIFALSFSASSRWPSLREIDQHIAFREWVVVGSLALVLLAFGALTDTATPATYGALLFLGVDIFGMFSFVRLFGLASTPERKRVLRRTLGRALSGYSDEARDLQLQMSTDPVISAFLGHFDELAARSDGNGIADLVEELADDSTPTRFGSATTALHLKVLHRLAKAALVGRLDAVVASACAETVTDSLLTVANAAREGASENRSSGMQAGVALGILSRYLAWLGAASLVLSTRGVSTSGTARELIAMTISARLRVLRAVDPDPNNPAGPHEVGTPLASPVDVMTWIWFFTQFHGAHQAAGMYPTYEILTGTRFLGNYWDGDSVLTQLRTNLFGSGSSLDTMEAAAARCHFSTIANFDHIWTLVSVDALATLRSGGAAHPPELVRPEFTPDPQLLGAYVWTFASHRYLSSADQAMDALVRTLVREPAPEGAWKQIRSSTNLIAWAAPVPITESHQRLAGCVLAIASRLAPLSAAESSRELSRFLAALPPAVLHATAKLANRTLPAPTASGATGDSVHTSIIDRLQVLQTVGQHRALTS